MQNCIFVRAFRKMYCNLPEREVIMYVVHSYNLGGGAVTTRRKDEAHG